MVGLMMSLQNRQMPKLAISTKAGLKYFHVIKKVKDSTFQANG
jgi:hypothetical protein